MDKKKSQAKNGLLGYDMDDPKECRLMLNKLTDNILNKGMMPKDALGLPEDFLENIYAMAYEMLNQGRVDDAKGLFSYLIGLNMKQFKYMLGYAAALHQQQKYQEAFQAYSIAILLDPNHPLPFYFSADCMIQLGFEQQAIQALIATIRLAVEMNDYLEYADKAELLLNQLIDAKN